jgi:outer membrane lipopolysaccharide assembly protein LptE/RlpB
MSNRHPPGTRAFVLFLALSAAGGCGMHLRGTSTEAEELRSRAIHLDSNKAPNVTLELRQILAASDVKLLGKPKGADYIIRVAGERVTREVLSVSPQTGKVEEFQLNYVVRLSLLRPGAAPLIEDVPIALQRDFTFDQDAVLGNFSEEETLRDELAREAAEQILRRSSAAISRDLKAAAR